MAKHEITRQFSNKGNRNEVRLRVVEAFSNEEPGIGTGLELFWKEYDLEYYFTALIRRGMLL